MRRVGKRVCKSESKWKAWVLRKWEFWSLCRRLHRKHPSERIDAVQALRRIADSRSVKALLSAVKDEDCKVSVAAIMALDAIGDRRALGPLHVAFKKGVRDRLNAALQKGVAGTGNALSVFGIASAKILIEALRSSDLYVRHEAISGLSRVDADEVIEPLISAIQIPDTWVQREAVRALAKRKEPHVTQVLLETLQSNDMPSIVRTIAVEGVASRTDPRVCDVLIAALDDEDESVRRAAVESLEEQEDPRIGAALIVALRNKDKKVAICAATALGNMKNHEALGELILCLRTLFEAEGYEQSTADLIAVAKSIAMIGGSQALQTLMSLYAKHTYVIYSALKVFAEDDRICEGEREELNRTIEEHERELAEWRAREAMSQLIPVPDDPWLGPLY